MEQAKELWEMTQEAEKKVEQVIRNVERRKYSKLAQADYSNEGVDLFDSNQFAMDLGMRPSDLEDVLGVRRMPPQFVGGKGIMIKPTPEEMRAIVPKLSDYLRKSKVEFFIRQGNPVPAEVLADYQK